MISSKSQEPLPENETLEEVLFQSQSNVGLTAATTASESDYNPEPPKKKSKKPYSEREMFELSSDLSCQFIKNGIFDISSFEFPPLPLSFNKFNKSIIADEQELLNVDLKNMFMNTARVIWPNLSLAYKMVAPKDVLRAVTAHFTTCFKNAQTNFLKRKLIDENLKKYKSIG